MSGLTEKNIEFLRLLNQYRFLTNAQFLRLGLVKEQHSIYKIAARFATGKNPHVGKKDFGFVWGKGRLPHLYYLKKRGARMLTEALRLDDDEVHYEGIRPPFVQDYLHRMAVIDFHIELDLFCQKYGCKLPFFHIYFDTEGANRGTPASERLRRMTKVPLGKYHLIPDGIFLVDTPDNKQRLFALEVYNGRDTKRVHKQLARHLQAQAEGAVALAYDLRLPCRVLLLFETENAMQAVMKRIREDSVFGESERYFAFSTLEAIREDFARNWWFFSEKQGSIF
jgi:hypothetical protein